jgi:hypothetical protein
MKIRFIYLNGWMRILHVMAVGAQTIQCVRSASSMRADVRVLRYVIALKDGYINPYTDGSLLLLNSSSAYFKLQKRNPRFHDLSSFPRCSSRKPSLRAQCVCDLPSKRRNQRNEKHDARLHDLLSLSVFYSPKRQLGFMPPQSCRKTIRHDA